MRTKSSKIKLIIVGIILLLLSGCAITLEDSSIDFEKGWVIDSKTGERHFYGGEVKVGVPMKCYIHGVEETVYLVKDVENNEELQKLFDTK
tara:strand:+ start:2044 stop:2316 length:273 start_codon:yes stop_codon:yes gene_type:complete